MSECCTPSINKTPLKKPTLRVALVGNPNCGKTTLFNALTGGRQRVGNWPGVTVERKSGLFTQNSKLIEVIDLPGVYSLVLPSDTGALDERIACEFILTECPDVIINIVDALHLERHLYLTAQLLEMGMPIILAVNMIDKAQAQHLTIHFKQLSARLGCPVIALAATKQQGVSDLKCAMIDYKNKARNDALSLPLAAPLKKAIATLAAQIDSVSSAMPIDKTWLAMRLLENDLYVKRFMTTDLSAQIAVAQAEVQSALGEEADILLAERRYQANHELVQQCVTTSGVVQKTWTTRIDNLVLNRILGIPIFLGMMYLLFLFAINVGGALQDFFDIGSQTIFVGGFAYLLEQMSAPTWLIALLTNGIGVGISTTLTFIPVIGAMFLFLALLEDSGYMARAAFVIDRFMRALGLPGKAFVPMIVGFGCNVPAVMAARTLENKRDRILTIMMSPFMSCGARLAIYAVFTAAFFPRGGQNIVFALYLIGIVMAVLTGFILRKTLLRGEPAPLIMELPSYHRPHVKTVLLHAWQRLKGFVFRAGKLIVPICVLIGAMNTLNIDGTLNSGEGDARSLLSVLGQGLTPLFAPMGIGPDNWPATVGLVTGVLAKEVVVGTLNTLYTQMGQLVSVGDSEGFQFWAGLQEAFHSIPANLAELSSAMINPLAVEAPDMTTGVYGLMYQQFDGQIGAFAYLLFVLLYFPCVSTTAAMLREVHRGWSVFSVLWMTGVAYGVAVLFYQIATWARHPLSSCAWVLGVSAVFLGTLFLIRGWAARGQRVSTRLIQKRCV